MKETQVLDGRTVAAGICGKVKKKVLSLKEDGVVPRLCVILIGDNIESKKYVQYKEKKCAELGISFECCNLAKDVEQTVVFDKIRELNRNDLVHGILIQLPLPEHLPATRLLNAVSPDKDVDGLTEANFSKLAMRSDPLFVPCTAAGILALLQEYNVKLSGAHVVVIGRSLIVGTPLMLLMLAADATVTVCHSHTKNVKALTKTADIVITAVGKPEFVKADWIKDGAVVVDVGINFVQRDGVRKLVGDVDFQRVKEVASLVSPVPGGVGPLTIASLMNNTLTAALRAFDSGVIRGDASAGDLAGVTHTNVDREIAIEKT